MSRPVFGVVIVVASIVVGCRATRDSHSSQQPAPPPIRPTVLQYVNTEAFDVVFETSLINRDPVIIVQTQNEKPDWEGRLNAWIAAWNMGGKGERRIVRSQIPIPTANIDADFLREFRLLVFGAVDRAEDLAKAGASWWHDERTRSHRVSLLKRYNLRFHIREDKRIDLIFFNGDYAARYREFVTAITHTESRDWSRTVECSMCKKLQADLQGPVAHTSE